MNRDLTVVSVHCLMMIFFEGFKVMITGTIHFMLGIYHFHFPTNSIPLSRWKARRHQNIFIFEKKNKLLLILKNRVFLAHCLLDINVSSLRWFQQHLLLWINSLNYKQNHTVAQNIQGNYQDYLIRHLI